MLYVFLSFVVYFLLVVLTGIAIETVFPTRGLSLGFFVLFGLVIGFVGFARRYWKGA